MIANWLHDFSTMSKDSKPLKRVGDFLLLQLPNELSGSASSQRISTPVLPVEGHSLLSISEWVTLFYAFHQWKGICSTTSRLSISACTKRDGWGSLK